MIYGDIDFIPAVGAIIEQKNKILLLLRRHAPEAFFWTLPGGKILPMESPSDAIIRELKEEIGVDALISYQFPTPEKILQGDGFQWLSFTFVASISSKPFNKEPGTHAEMRWFPLQNLPDKITVASKKAIERYFSTFLNTHP